MTNDSIVRAIVRKWGGYREKAIMSKPHSIKRGDTWNNEHRVLDVLAKHPDEDGYYPGFQVDLVTMSICG